MAEGQLSVPERRYQAIVAKIADKCRAAEGENLKRYHMIGGLFAEFMQGLERNRYGDATAEKLAADLQSSGVLAEISDPRRFLYWAKGLHETYPDLEKLGELARLGFTVTHAKKLLQYSSEVRQEAESRMIQDGRVVSSRILDDIVKEINQARIASAATTAAEDARAAREEEPDGEEPEGEEEAPDSAAVEAEAGDTEIEDPTEEAESEEAAPAERPARASATGRPTNPEVVVSNPLKALRDVEKAVTRANAGIPSAFIVIRQSSQTGFDSDTARDRYLNHLRSLKANAQALLEPMQELLRSVDEELNAAELPDESP